MREIKFRGKVDFNIEELSIGELSIEHDNGWVYGNLIVDGDVVFIVGGIADWDSEYLAHDWWIMADPDTVGQYTGLKDKNGRDIYEGDILKLPSNHKNRIVFWVKGGFAVESLDSDVGQYGKLTYTPIEGLSDEQNASWAEQCKIIGNIHDNPELLKE